MGKIDETLLYNGFNSYEFSDGDETLWNETFNVALYSHISVQLVTIKLGGTATGKFIVRWIDEDKKKIGNDNEISFDVTNRWSRKTATLEVPENADTAMIAINGAYFHIACPMAEAGEIATAFDPSLASKMAWHDATGSYVGFLSANQIVAGILRSVTGDSGFDLELPRIWMKSNDGEVTWEATPENPLTVKDKDGKLISGIVQIDEKYGLVSQFLALSETANVAYGSVGYEKDAGSGYKFTWNGHEFLLSFTKEGYGTQLNIDKKVRQVWESDGSNYLLDNNRNYRLYLHSDGTNALLDNNKVMRYGTNPQGETYMFNDEGDTVFWIGRDGGAGFYNSDGNTRFRIYESGATTIFGNNNNPRIETYANGEMAIRNNSGELRIGVESNGNSPYLYNGTCTIAIDNTGAYIGSAYGKRIEVHNNGSTYIKDDYGNIRFFVGVSGNMYMKNHATNDEIGIDATGPYYIKSGTKKYFT